MHSVQQYVAWSYAPESGFSGFSATCSGFPSEQGTNGIFAFWGSSYYEIHANRVLLKNVAYKVYTGTRRHATVVGSASS